MKTIIVLCSILLLLVPFAALAQDFCEGNFDYDQDVDGTDAFQFKTDFGRSTLLNPCPPDGPAPVERTWQSTSYAVGDDGYYQKGVEWSIYRYTDNGNGTVTDNLTGLIWMKDANCFGGLQTWNDAVSLVLNNVANGYCGLTDGSSPGDWRLPNIKEMLSLVDYNAHNPAMWWWDFFNNVQSNYYWSSTTKDDVANVAWVVSMEAGYVVINSKTDPNYVWPVRGGH